MKRMIELYSTKDDTTILICPCFDTVDYLVCGTDESGAILHDFRIWSALGYNWNLLHISEDK